MIKYVKCPRCDLNYIDEEKQEYCDVCLAEMRGSKLQFADLDVDELVDDEMEEEEATELCPVCGINRIRAGEQMCDSCKQKENYEAEAEVDPENDEEWKNYLDEDDESDDLTVDDEELAEELEGDDDSSEEDDEYYEGNEEDDFDLDGDFDDDNYDDDDDEDDDDDDDDDEF